MSDLTVLTFNQFCLNTDVILEIFKYLGVRDQLNLANTSAQLNLTYQIFVRTPKYQTLKISEKYFDFLLSNEMTSNPALLNEEELQEFLRYYANKVRKLEVTNILNLQSRVLRKNIIGLDDFKNLKSLKYHYMNISKEHFNDIARYMLGLEEFSLKKCSMDLSMDEVVQEIVTKMKNLKKLCLYKTCVFGLMYSGFRDILALENLEQLELAAKIDFNKNKDIVLQTNALKDLNINIGIDSITRPYILPPSCFGNLISLTIGHYGAATGNYLTVLAQSCTKLEILNIRNTVFVNIRQFSVPPKLKELTIKSCMGLSYQHLRTILTELKITRFQSIQTCYDGVLESFQISPLLKSLKIDVTTQDIQFLHRPNNLEECKMHTLLTDEDYEEGRLKSIKFAFCSGLRILDLENYFVPLSDLQAMRNLHTLKMPQLIAVYGWVYIMELLQLPSLRVLMLRNHYFIPHNSVDENVPIPAFPIKIEDLTTPSEVFEERLDFWLYLWNHNKSLKRLCFTCDPYAGYDKQLRTLIKHPAFPKNLSKLYFCGLLTYCNDLRSNFDNEVKRLRRMTDYSINHIELMRN